MSTDQPTPPQQERGQYVPDKEAMAVNLFEGVIDDSTTANLRYGERGGAAGDLNVIDERVYTVAEMRAETIARLAAEENASCFAWDVTRLERELASLRAQLQAAQQERDECFEQLGTDESVGEAVWRARHDRLQRENEAMREVVSAAQGIALRDSPTHKVLRRALAHLDEQQQPVTRGETGTA